MTSKITDSGRKKKITSRMSTASNPDMREQIGKSGTSYRDEVWVDVGKDGAVIRFKPQRSVSQKAKQFLKKYRNRTQADQALDVLGRIDKIVENFGDLDLSEIYVSKAPDGSLGMVWNVADATLGITIDLNPEESHWFLLVGPQNKAVTAYGRLGKLDIDTLLSMVVNLLEKIKRNEFTHA
jgi:hypothetical protein